MSVMNATYSNGSEERIHMERRECDEVNVAQY